MHKLTHTHTPLFLSRAHTRTSTIFHINNNIVPANFYDIVFSFLLWLMALWLALTIAACSLAQSLSFSLSLSATHFHIYEDFVNVIKIIYVPRALLHALYFNFYRLGSVGSFFLFCFYISFFFEIHKYTFMIILKSKVWKKREKKHTLTQLNIIFIFIYDIRYIYKYKERDICARSVIMSILSNVMTKTTNRMENITCFCRCFNCCSFCWCWTLLIIWFNFAQMKRF